MTPRTRVRAASPTKPSRLSPGAVFGRGPLKHQASGGGVGIQGAIRALQTGLRGGELATAVDHFANGAHTGHLRRKSFHQVHTEFRRRVGATRRHARVHRTAQRRVQQRGEPTAVDRAQGVEVGFTGRALKYRTTCIDLDQQVVQGLGDRCKGQPAVEYTLHHL